MNRLTNASLFGAAALALGAPLAAQPTQQTLAPERSLESVRYETVEIEGLDIFYREAGDPQNPTVLLLHGFPTSSHMFRNLIPVLSEAGYHVVAPDYPGYGNSSMPTVTEFEYSFDNLARIVTEFIKVKGIDSYSLYLMDYGAPIGYRIAAAAPERVDSLIIQNGNAYEEGLRDFWDPIRVFWNDPSPTNAAPLAGFLTLDVTRWQYTHGTRDESSISPDNWIIDQYLLDRPGNDLIQLELFYSYRTNVPLYPEWQEYFRTHQPPAIIVWGANDYIFPAEGAYPYQRDLEDLEFHLFDTGHFALEEDGETISALIADFLDRKVER